MKLNSRRDILLMAAVILGAMFPAVAVQRQHPAVRDAEANRHNFNQALATLAKLRDGQEAAETIEEQPLIIVEADPAEKAVPAEDGASSAATESP